MPRCFDPFGHNLSYANLTSCGVIIAAALVHLLGDASEGDLNENYPWSYVICGLSFISLFAFERLLIHTMLHKEDDSSTPGTANHDHGAHRHSLDAFNLMQRQHYISGIILFCGLGVHSMLAGLALGSTLKSTTIVALGIAILSHKYLAAFAIGCSLHKSSVSLRTSTVFAVSFAMLTPTGIVIGVSIEDEISEMAESVLVSMAAGALLYAAICEVMIPEFTEKEESARRVGMEYGGTAAVNVAGGDVALSRAAPGQMNNKQKNIRDALKLFCVFLGFGVMSMLAVWV